MRGNGDCTRYGIATRAEGEKQSTIVTATRLLFCAKRKERYRSYISLRFLRLSRSTASRTKLVQCNHQRIPDGIKAGETRTICNYLGGLCLVYHRRIVNWSPKLRVSRSPSVCVIRTE